MNILNTWSCSSGKAREAVCQMEMFTPFFLLPAEPSSFPACFALLAHAYSLLVYKAWDRLNVALSLVHKL